MPLSTQFIGPTYIHSDYRASFMTGNLRTHLLEEGVAGKALEPKSNGYCKRYNDIIYNYLSKNNDPPVGYCTARANMSFY